MSAVTKWSAPDEPFAFRGHVMYMQLPVFLSLPRPEDHILPYCADERHTPDTLFIVAEEDWRIYEAEAALGPEELARHINEFDWMAMDLEEEAPALDAQDLYARRCERYPLQGREKAGETVQPSGGTIYEAGVGFYSRRCKEKGQDVPPPTNELVDIVKICTAAHRRKCGGLVWLCYESAKNKKDKTRRVSPRNGLMAIAITAEHARRMQGDFSKFRFCHFDIALRELLEFDEQARATWECSYVFPPIGNYISHVSGCEEGLGVRTASWSYRWVQEGTRVDVSPEGREHGSVHRWLVPFKAGIEKLRNTEQLGAQAKQVLVLPEGPADDDLRWFTLKPPEEARPCCACEPSVSVQTDIVRPFFLSVLLLTCEAWKALTMLQHPAQPAEERTQSKRHKRALRGHKTMYKLRNFVDTKAEAVGSMKEFSQGACNND